MTYLPHLNWCRLYKGTNLDLQIYIKTPLITYVEIRVLYFSYAINDLMKHVTQSFIIPPKTSPTRIKS